jgi:hypothetical protein
MKRPIDSDMQFRCFKEHHRQGHSFTPSSKFRTLRHIVKGTTDTGDHRSSPPVVDDACITVPLHDAVAQNFEEIPSANNLPPPDIVVAIHNLRI